MRKRYLAAGLIIGFGIISTFNGCIESYHPPTSSSNPAYLVVDGFLNSTDKSCKISLTHTVPLSNDAAYTPVPELHAAVLIEEEGGGNTFTLVEAAQGDYSASSLNIDDTKKYRIKITTASHNEYVSDFVPVVKTPAIDSVSWGPERTGMHILVSTHDPSNSTRYYMWSYVETWNYNAGFESEYILTGPGATTAVLRPTSFYSCFSTQNSNSLLLSSSAKLSSDIISQFPVTLIPWQSPKLSKKYSIIVTQRGLTQSAYDYFEQVKKNTENLGTLFGPLPSTISGNLQSTTNPSEPVIGYFTAGAVDTKRIFIATQDFHRPADAPRIITGYESCAQDSAFFKNGPINSGELVTPLYEGLTVIGWTTSPLGCVDCRYQGGTLTKPAFWQ